MQLRAMAMPDGFCRCRSRRPARRCELDDFQFEGTPIKQSVVKGLAGGGFIAQQSLAKVELGNGELVFDRARLLLADLGLERIADDVLGLVLALDGGGHDLVECGLHAVGLELAHKLEELRSFHQMVLLEAVVAGTIGGRRMA